MGKVLSGGGQSQGSSIQGYVVPVGSCEDQTGFEAAIVMRVAGTVSRFATSVNATGNTRVGRLRKNSTNVNSILTFADGVAQALYDTTHTDDYSIGDTLSANFTDGGTAAGAYWRSFVFEAAGGGAVGFYGTRFQVNVGGTYYVGLQGTVGGQDATTEDARAYVRMRTAGTVQSGVCFNAKLNSTTGTVTWRMRKNSADAAIVCSIAGATTGRYEDTTNTVSFVSGDTLGWKITGGSGSPPSTMYGIATVNYGAADYEAVAAGSYTATGSDQYLPFCAGASAWGNVGGETPYKMQHGFSIKVQKLRTYLFSNTVAVTATVKVRKNGADGNNTLSIGASTTGAFEDTTNTDNFLATDDINYVIRGGSSGTFTTYALTSTVTATGYTFVANNLTVGSPVLGTPAYTKNAFDLIAVFPPHGPTFDAPFFNQKQKFVPVNLTVGRPFFQIPGLVGLTAASLIVGRPEIAPEPPKFSHPYGPHEQIPTLSQQIGEADDILQRALDALVAGVPNRLGGGRPAWDFRRAVGDLRANGKRLIFDGTLGAPAAKAWTLATDAGATFDTMDAVRLKLLPETPQFVPAQAVAHLTLELTVAQMSRISSQMTFMSRDEALSMLQRISAAYEPVEEDLADEQDAMMYRAVVALRAATVRDLADRGRQLPRVVNYSFQESMPGLWLANRIYADASRFEELRNENDWIHPAFPPPSGKCLSR